MFGYKIENLSGVYVISYKNDNLEGDYTLKKLFWKFYLRIWSKEVLEQSPLPINVRLDLSQTRRANLVNVDEVDWIGKSTYIDFERIKKSMESETIYSPTGMSRKERR